MDNLPIRTVQFKFFECTNYVTNSDVENQGGKTNGNHFAGARRQQYLGA